MISFWRAACRIHDLFIKGAPVAQTSYVGMSFNADGILGHSFEAAASSKIQKVLVRTEAKNCYVDLLNLSHSSPQVKTQDFTVIEVLQRCTID